ncbi:heterotrimeric G protein alpha subunit A [Radiomyces spectabilis]|uniref:heterotrimeric G protein alpha subunit A n=1 Tax=Radiomyces spectabilis TaxID=64574 RepID=UPI00221E5305|nr:heterotrimeric G protein alpha subunit A [Radiomyces spectabilis]KAI8370443.1 heterotrimeric G protein alpha subunit A [Radiomyces spectabilis]
MPSIMDICISAEERENKQRSQKIDRELMQDHRRHQQECKILLLGSGESGKSTIVKQMKIIHQNGYTTDELRAWKHTVYKNLIDSAKDIISTAHKLELSFTTLLEVDMDVIREYTLSAEPFHEFSESIVNAIDKLWNDPVMTECLERGSSQFYIMDSAPYFLSHLHRLTKPGYVPTVDDVLHARLKTTGITETRFSMGELSVHMFDVGGQRSERKKWIHCFESVTSIMFCVALSEYNQVLLEESRQNRMVESLVLFESVINSRWFLRTSIILFLNKIDLFREKLQKVPLDLYFPDYTGGPSADKACVYILWRFQQTNRMKLKIYAQLTQATNTSNVRTVFKVVQDRLLKECLTDSGLM